VLRLITTLAVHLMISTVITSTAVQVDGGQQLAAG
jgi:hypothetical protein